jgi:hypothetical protein
VLFEFGWESVAHTVRRRESANRIGALFGYALFGSLVGLVSVYLLPRPIVAPGGVPGVSLILVPVVVGVAMNEYGRFRRNRGIPTTHLATFSGGATFAFFTALVRFALRGGSAVQPPAAEPLIR